MGVALGGVTVAVPTAAYVDTGAITRNVQRLKALAGTSQLCAVVKANGYGHGSLEASRAAIQGGASWLAVSSLVEAAELEPLLKLSTRRSERPAMAEASNETTPASSPVKVLVLSEIAPAQAANALAAGAGGTRLTVASVRGIEALHAEAKRAEVGAPIRVHLKIDTGMHRMGATSTELAAVFEALRRAAPLLALEAVWTHFAVADHPDDRFTAEQLQRFEQSLRQIHRTGLEVPMLHAANSAGLIAHPGSRLDLVRTGIACYGVAPSTDLECLVELEPALSLRSTVTAVRTVEPGESVSYGRSWFASEPTRVATVAIGYADGIRRDSASAGIQVLVRGYRCPIIGAVTMDQTMIALDQRIADDVVTGDDVVLIGRQHTHKITATEIADRLSTIPYEILTGISARVARITL